MEAFIKGAEQVTLFCRLNMNIKRELPIRPSEMGMLIYLIKSDEPKSPIKIAEFFKVTKPNVTAMVKSLEKSGYLLKRKSTSDKRSFVLEPTQKAVDLVLETYNEYFKTMEILNSKMGTDNYKKLIDLLEKANNILLEEQNNG